MYKFIIFNSFVFLMSFAQPIYSCSQAEDSSRVTIAGGSLTEIIYLLRQEDKLVAVDITSNFPEEAKQLPSIGYVRALSAEGVLSLSPSLILGEDDTGPPAVMEQLSRVGIQIEIIPEENTADGIIKKVKCVAEILGVNDNIKDETLSNLNADANELKLLTETNKKEPPKVMFILSMESGSPTVGGRDTSADGLIKMTGALNVMDSFEGWKPVSTEAIIQAKPDFILISERGLNSFGSIEKLGQHPSLVFTPAAKNNNIIAMDGMAMLGFGPRTISSAKDIAQKYNYSNE
ncbi:MAG: hemin ABC transporter substrate-binding protein [Gammaproteobacteria bacterium]|nr:hemin ABC transporter substrate-binding protein [Gammaproteobacteria bacterium]|tara:strand:+ start:2386 stop:3255 length:870 start_codon:yes stop_codon:yes gene_type:complete